MSELLTNEMKERLLAEAWEAREKAYVPYSNFAVGAALLTVEGKVFHGCNIENSSYGLTNCAERSAIFSAVSAGFSDFAALAVVCDSPGPCSPCGSCRQVIAEFGDDILLLLANKKGDLLETTISDLLPGYFKCEDMMPGAE
ncbi:MAG: cytidine deaminase [Halanaerobium sp.]|nr:cytidine deaminase [Halanaerobium sp.]